MPNLKRIFRYTGQYGIKSTVGLVREKLIVDKKRFSVKKVRALPAFPAEYTRAELPLTESTKSGYTVLYALHYYYPDKKGGTERFTLNIAKEAQKRGNTPKVLVLDANRPLSDYTERFGDVYYRYYEHDGIVCIGFRYKKAPLGLYYKRVSLEDDAMRAFARHIIERESVDLVHATYPQPFAPFLDECRAIGVPYVVTCTDFAMMCHYSTMVDNHGDFCLSTDGGRRCSEVCATYGCRNFASRLAAAREILANATIVTVPSEFVAKIMSREFSGIGFLPVNHGISEAFSYKAREGRVKRFVYAGTISPLKGIHLLLEAFARIPDPDVSLEIWGAGDGRYESELRKKADPRVKFCGVARGEDMPGIYSAADCVVVPSMWYETYNFVLREAANTGALVLAADIGAMSEAISEGENGYLFTPSDSEALYEGLSRCLAFDFADYRSRKYPTLGDEGEAYDAIYSHSLEEKL